MTIVAVLILAALASGEVIVAQPFSEDLSALDQKIGQLHKSGKYAEAISLAERYVALAGQRHGKESLEFATAVKWLALLYKEQARYGEAEPLYKRALAIEEKTLGSNHRDVATTVNNLALLYTDQGRYSEAELLHKRSIAILERALGPDHPDVAIYLNNLATLYFKQGRHAEAEPLYKRSLAIDEKRYGPDDIEVARALNNLAALFGEQAQYAEAEQLYKRSLVIAEKTLGPDHAIVGKSLSNLAALYFKQGRYAESERLMDRARAVFQKSYGPNHPEVASSLNDLAVLYISQGRRIEAELLLKRSLAIDEKSYGPDDPAVASSLYNLSNLYFKQGRYAESERLLDRAHAIFRKSYGPDHPEVASSLSDLAAVYFVQRDWRRAANYWRQSTGVIARRALRGLAGGGETLTGIAKSEAKRSGDQFFGLVKSIYRLSVSQAPEMFETAQWVLSSEAASSLAQMVARGAKGDPVLADVVRERQDLVAEWKKRDQWRTTAVQQRGERNKDAEAANSMRLDAIDKRIGEIDSTLKKKFPDYAALVSPEPLGVPGVQKQLRENEALILFLDTPEYQPTPAETFIWVVTKTDTRWVRTDLGTEALNAGVAALRCGLDDEEWVGIERPARCGKLLHVEKPREKDPLPFSLSIAHELYQALFGSVEDLIRGKNMLIVPSGPLTSLPFQVLVTEKPETALPKSYADYRSVAWLGRRQPLTVLPSVASLRALREFSKGGRGSQDYIGYGDPVLVGDGSCRKITTPQTCPSRETAVARTAGQIRQPRNRTVRRSPNVTEVFSRGGGREAVLNQVRALCPLDDTAYEVKCIAQSLPKSQIRIRNDATVANIKALSDSGELATYRVVHFATHGLLAGDVHLMTRLQGEPALVLTPPREPRDIDDNGLLTASKVTELKLNADWVVLSACNTAAGDQLGAEALSGLARAFFYAGARALLVSHWPVYSDAAVRLTTKAFAEMEADAGVTRAVAMRRAMVALMDDATEEDNAHPSVWAPFVLVGEGGK
jgi:CHAT domain-containing protein/tetratricopeptide (TPR) repeat protein